MAQRTPPVLEDPDALVSDPSELLLAYLDWYRDTALRKVAGLSDAQLRRAVEPLGWSPLGLIQHLGWVERRWMRWGFAAEDVVPYPDGNEDAEWRIAPDRSTDDVLAAYADEVRRSRALAGGADLDTRSRTGGRFPDPDQAPSLGRILFHLLQEYARHTGHLDIARELIDGQTGE
jgi:uncharacterized damage-inducible protein DinB